MFKSTFLISLLLIYSNSLFANSISASQKHTMYFGVGTGSMDVTVPGELTYEYHANLTNQLGYRFQFNNYLAFDARYLNGSKAEIAEIANNRDLNVDFTGLALSAQLRLSLSDRAFLFSHIGSNNYQWRHDGFRAEGDVLFHDRKKISGNSLTYTAGIKFEFTEYELAAEHQWVDMNGIDMGLYSVSVGYRF